MLTAFCIAELKKSKISGSFKFSSFFRTTRRLFDGRLYRQQS
jgi:hypothetical protein